jgi:hypothetical protein
MLSRACEARRSRFPPPDLPADGHGPRQAHPCRGLPQPRQHTRLSVGHVEQACPASVRPGRSHIANWALVRPGHAAQRAGLMTLAEGLIRYCTCCGPPATPPRPGSSGLVARRGCRGRPAC